MVLPKSCDADFLHGKLFILHSPYYTQQHPFPPLNDDLRHLARVSFIGPSWVGALSMMNISQLPNFSSDTHISHPTLLKTSGGRQQLTDVKQIKAMFWLAIHFSQFLLIKLFGAESRLAIRRKSTTAC